MSAELRGIYVVLVITEKRLKIMFKNSSVLKFRHFHRISVVLNNNFNII
jgi:hypothetical protein